MTSKKTEEKQTMSVFEQKNLKNRTAEERKQIARLGAEATNKKIKQKISIREHLEAYLDAKCPNSDKKYIDEIALAILEKAKEGDVSAFNSVRDSIGQKPKEEVQAVCMPIINIKGI